MGRWTLKQSIDVYLSISLALAPFSLANNAFAKKIRADKNAAGASISMPAANLPAAAVTIDSAPPYVRAFEQRLFFRTYESEQLLPRVERIEKQLFGQALTAPTPDRLARIQNVLQQQEAEEQKNKQLLTARPATAANPINAASNRTNPAVQADDDDRLEQARAAIQNARDEEIASLLAEGVNLYRAKRGTQAIERFEQALRLDPNNAEAHFNMGIIEESMGNYVEALSSYKQASSQQPENKEYQEAVAAITVKADKQQKNAGHRADLRQLADSANAAWKRGEYLSALDLYQQLDAKEPNRALVKYNIGSIFLMLKDQKQALSYYAQAYKLAPAESKFATAYQELAASQAKTQEAQAKVDQETLTLYGNQPFAGNNGKNKPSKKQKSAGSYAAPPPSGQAAVGRTSFGVPAGMTQQFLGTGSGAINNMAAFNNNGQMQNQMPGQGITMMPQGEQSSYMPVQQQQQQAQNTMLSYGMIGQTNRAGGVTLVTIGMASRAAAAGLLSGDVVQTIDGYQVSSPEEFGQILMRLNPAKRIPLVIMRNGALAVVNM